MVFLISQGSTDEFDTALTTGNRGFDAEYQAVEKELVERIKRIDERELFREISQNDQLGSGDVLARIARYQKCGDYERVERIARSALASLKDDNTARIPLLKALIDALQHKTRNSMEVSVPPCKESSI